MVQQQNQIWQNDIWGITLRKMTVGRMTFNIWQKISWTLYEH
jgi:hypothetical protein